MKVSISDRSGNTRPAPLTDRQPTDVWGGGSQKGSVGSEGEFQICSAFICIWSTYHNGHLVDVDVQTWLINELRLRARQQQCYISMQGRMYAAWDLYQAGELSAIGLLKRSSTIYQPHLMRPLVEWLCQCLKWLKTVLVYCCF